MVSKGHLFIVSVLGKRALWNGVQFNVDPELSRLAMQVMTTVVACAVTSLFPGSHFTGFVRGLYLECLVEYSFFFLFFFSPPQLIMCSAPRAYNRT